MPLPMRCGSGYGRHWFTRRGSTGDCLPYCWRCGAANPRCAADAPRHRTARGRLSSPTCGRQTNETGYCADHQTEVTERDLLRAPIDTITKALWRRLRTLRTQDWEV